MHSTLFRAGRATHLKIVLVSLVAAVAVVAVGLNARTGSLDTADTAVVKAGHTPAFAAKDAATVR